MDKNQLDQVSQFFEIFNIQKVMLFLVGILILVAFVKLIGFVADKFEKTFPSRRLLISQVETIFSFFLISLVLIFYFFYYSTT